MKAETDLLAAFTRSFDELTGGKDVPTLLLAVSGGADSLVMMDLVARLSAKRRFSAHVVSVDHRLRDESNQDTAFVEAQAKALGFPVTIASIDTNEIAQKHRLSLEAAARKGRYSALLAQAKVVGAGMIFIAHTKDDQVETILLHLLRGTSIDGLSGMQAISPLNASHLLDDDETTIKIARPMLTISRSEIDRYCADNSLNPREDITNRDESYRRNWLRHRIIPQLVKEIPTLGDHLITLAALAEADSALLNDLTDQTLNEIQVDENSDSITLSRKKWLKLPLALKRRVLRGCCQRLSGSFTDLSFTHLEAAIHLLTSSEAGSISEFPHEMRVVHDGDEIIVRMGTPAKRLDWPALTPGQEIALSPEKLVSISDGQWLCQCSFIEPVPSDAALSGIYSDRWQAALDADCIGGAFMLRTRHRGDRFFPQGTLGTVSVSDFMTDQKVPRTMRDALPLLVSGDRILWVSGYRVDQHLTITDATRRILWVRFTPV